MTCYCWCWCHVRYLWLKLVLYRQRDCHHWAISTRGSHQVFWTSRIKKQSLSYWPDHERCCQTQLDPLRSPYIFVFSLPFWFCRRLLMWDSCYTIAAALRRFRPTNFESLAWLTSLGLTIPTNNSAPVQMRMHCVTQRESVAYYFGLWTSIIPG